MIVAPSPRAHAHATLSLLDFVMAIDEIRHELPRPLSQIVWRLMHSHKLSDEERLNGIVDLKEMLGAK